MNHTNRSNHYLNQYSLLNHTSPFYTNLSASKNNSNIGQNSICIQTPPIFNSTTSLLQLYTQKQLPLRLQQTLPRQQHLVMET